MFLDLLNKLLKENNLNKRQFAIKSGIPYTTIDGLYKKGHENIRLPTLQKIADFFDVSLDYLVFGEERNFNENNTVSLSPEYIEKYRKLDNHSKELINMIIDKELERVETNIP